MKKKFFITICYCFTILSYNKPIEFTIIVPTYNNEKYCQKNLISIINQDYANFDVIIINDNSQDKTKIILESYIKSKKLNNKIKLINNFSRKGAMENWYNAINSCQDHKVIVMVDGDDQLAHNGVLTKLAKEYNSGNIYMTYGQYKSFPSGTIGLCKEFPRDIIKKNKFRKYKWLSSHLRTGFAGLFKKIKKEDFFYNNQFYPMSADRALMIPALEMSSNGHIKFISEVLYIYNETNPINDWKVNTALLWDTAKHISLKKPYAPLEKLECLSYYE